MRRDPEDDVPEKGGREMEGGVEKRRRERESGVERKRREREEFKSKQGSPSSW